jgi:hypothetical protein
MTNPEATLPEWFYRHSPLSHEPTLAYTRGAEDMLATIELLFGKVGNDD